jgi:hypothetical protein
MRTAPPTATGPDGHPQRQTTPRRQRAAADLRVLERDVKTSFTANEAILREAVATFAAVVLPALAAHDATCREYFRTCVAHEVAGDLTIDRHNARRLTEKLVRMLLQAGVTISPMTFTRGAHQVHAARTSRPQPRLRRTSV